MNHTEHKAIELVRQTEVEAVRLGVAGSVGELELVEIVAVRPSFGTVEHVIDLTVFGKEGLLAGFAGSFAMTLGLVVIDNDGRVVHVEFLACIGKVEDSELEIQPQACY